MRRVRVIIRVLLIGLAFLIALSHSQTVPVSAGNNIWTSHGPEGGPVNALALDPVTPTTLYAGTGGGVFKSTDGGANWSAVNSGLTSTCVFALAIDPATPTTLYAGTGGGGVFSLKQVTYQSQIYLPLVAMGY